MGPLETSKDDLIKELAGYSSSGSAGAAATGGEKSPGLAAAIISVLGNVGSTLLANRLTQQRAEWQNQQNIAQWQRENAYNTPVAQMARLAAAGINPALAYSNGSVMNESANSPQLTSGQVMSPVQFDPLTIAQVANLNAQTSEIKSRIPVNEQTANHIAEQISTLKDMYASRSIDRLKSYEEFNSLLNSNNLFYETFGSQVASYSAKAKIDTAEAEFAFQRCQKQLDVLSSTYDDLVSSARYKEASTDVAKQMKDNLEQSYKQIGVVTEMMNKQKDLILKYGDSKEVLGMINQTLSATAAFTSGMANLLGTIMSGGKQPNVMIPNPYSNMSVSQ